MSIAIDNCLYLTESALIIKYKCEVIKMIFSNKEQEITNILLNSKEIITAEKIAELTNVSVKTVYRRIKKINAQSRSGKEIIISQRGKGLSLDNEEYQQTIHVKEIQTECPSRQMEVIFSLLLNSPRYTEIDELYSQQYVSSETIRLDIQKIRKMLSPYNLKLNRHKEKLRIIGEEEQIRSLLTELLNTKKILLNDNYLTNASMMTYADIDFITQQLIEIEQSLDTHISYPYNENIFIHIYVMMSRYKNNPTLLDSLGDEELVAKQIIANNLDLMKLSKKIIVNIEKYIGQKLNSEESLFLFQYLYSSRLTNNSNGFAKEESILKMAECLSKLVINYFELKVSPKILASEIYPHLKMMIYRVKQKINVSNELLFDIRREYKSLFLFLKREVVKIITEYEVSDDELGFLTLYFAKYMEQSSNKIKILVICSSGVGTSELLKVKITRSIPEVEVVEALSVNQFTKSISLERFKDIDLIVSTIKMNETYGIPCMLVNAIFTESDKKALKKRLEEL